ncbi:MAG: tyrosine-type recombinase/integrase [Peptococcus niger]
MPKTGTLRKKGNIYYYRFYVDGNLKEVTTGCSSKREAEKKADQIYEEYINIPPPDPSMSFKAIAEKFLEHEQRRVNEKASRPLAYASYAEKGKKISQTLIPYFGKTDITEITVYDIEEFFAEQLDHYANNTVKKFGVFLNQIFKFARKNRLVDYNPVEDADKPQYIKSTAAKTWTAEQAHAYLAFVRQGSKSGQIQGFYEPLVHLALLGGCRREEACGLRIEQVEILKDKVKAHLCLARTAVDYEIVEKDLKNHESRTIFLPIQSVPVFNALLIKQKEAILRYGRENVGDYIVSDDLFNPIHPDRASQYHRKVCGSFSAESGAPYIRLHDLRHTIATLLNNKKVDLAAISDLLGHKSRAITLDMYIHTDKENQLETAETTADIFTL